MSTTGPQTSDTTPSPGVRPAPSRPGGGKDERRGMLPPRRTWLWFVVAMIVNYFIVRMLTPGGEPSVTVPYTLFKEEVTKGNVQAIYSRGDTIKGRFKTAVTYPPATTRSAAPKGESQPNAARSAPARPAPTTALTFETTLPTFVDPGFEKSLIDHHVEISAKPIEEESNRLISLLVGFGPALLLIGLYVWMFRRAQQGGGFGGGLMGIGKSKARRYDKQTQTKVTFDDVAGIDEAENELVEIVDFLKDPKKYTRLGGTAPKGVLLVGAPGTGKNSPREGGGR